ncbi:MAG: hypothetical protein E7348_05180 [Clostridiales bacterium]|nr:hypothetical protein [Clostridiales bacterium]
MKFALKIKYLTFVLLFFVLCSSFLLTGCSLDGNYVGTYNSTFVDSQNDDISISFTLVIKEDNTFNLIRSYGNGYGPKTYSGYYKSYTNSGQKQLLCIIEEGFVCSIDHPNAWYPYFSICRLDDGTLMATSGTTSSSKYVFTAFGEGAVTKITLILFEKE